MSLDLLKERFGHSVSKNKKDTDNKEKIHEQLNDKFNSNSMDDLKSLKYQHQEDLEEKERIIESLEIEASELANEVLTLEKEKSTIIEELNNSKWMENTVALNTKKIYEDKIKTMNIVDSSKLIPLLIEVSREKQGNQKLNWGEWFKISENRYLFQINENIAKKVFKDTNVLIDRAINYINEKRRTYAGDEPSVAENYSLTFTGDTAASSTGDHVITTFNPNEYNLNLGFTVSYWVRADEVGTHMFAIGRKYSNSERFTFGIGSSNKIYIGVGPVKMEGTWAGNLDSHPSGQTAAQLFPSLFDDGDLKTGNWLHFVVTYVDRESTSEGKVSRKVFLNGELIRSNNLNWSAIDGEFADDGIYFGARNLLYAGALPGYNAGWACGLDEVAIYDEKKDSDWVASVYNGATDYDHTDATKSDRPDGGSQRGLVGYWKFNEGSGTTVKDLSGNGNHGTFATEKAHGNVGVETTDVPTWEER